MDKHVTIATSKVPHFIKNYNGANGQHEEPTKNHDLRLLWQLDRGPTRLPSMAGETLYCLRNPLLCLIAEENSRVPVIRFHEFLLVLVVTAFYALHRLTLRRQRLGSQ